MLPERKKAMEGFLKAYAMNLHIGKACDEVKIHRQQYIAWVTKDKWFRDQIDMIMGFEFDNIEASVRDLAKRGNIDAARLILDLRQQNLPKEVPHGHPERK
jgi:hypothetical protein